MANILKHITSTSMIPGYAPDHVGAQSHEANEPGVLWIDVDRILDSPYQHQEHLDPAEFQALVESMQKDGFLTALNVNEHPQRAGYYFLTAGGHQRRDAARVAGIATIPVFVEPPLDPIRLAFRAARENAIQVNRNRVNLGYLFLQIQAEFGLSQEEIAAELGKLRSFVANAIRAATSDPDIQELLCEKPDSLRAMIYLRRLNSPEDRAPIIARFRSGERTTDGVKAEVEAILQQQKAQVSRDSLSSSRRVEGAVGNTKRGGIGRLAPGTATTGGREAASEYLQTVGTASAMEHQTQERAASLHERVGKLSDIVSRVKSYQRMRGQQPLSPQEQALLVQLVSLGEALLASS